MGKNKQINPCTYKITNLENKNIYIGSTVNFLKRKSQHLYDLKNGFHHSKYLQRAFNKHGEINFIFEIIREYKIDTKIKVLRGKEQVLLDKFNPTYNMSKTAIYSPGKVVPVVKLSPTNNIIEYYNSIKDANLSMGKAPYDSGITSVIRGRSISFNKFKWIDNTLRKSKSVIIEESKNKGDKILPIQQINMETGEVVNEGYMNTFKELGYCHSAISGVIRGDRISHKGFTYRNYNPFPDKKYILGCDTGKKGAFSILDFSGNLVYKTPLFLHENGEYDIPRISKYIYNIKDYIELAGIEKVHSIFGTGKSTAFKMGYGLGFILGIFYALDIPFLHPSPKEWQEISWGGIPRNKDTKITSNNAVNLYFPDSNFLLTSRHRVPHDGMIDATLIALFVLKKLR